MVAEVNVPSRTAASPHQFEQLHPRLGPHDRFIGRTEGFKHPCQTILLFLCLRFFVRTIEIYQGEGDIFRKALQKFDQLGRKRSSLQGIEDDHTLRASPLSNGSTADDATPQRRALSCQSMVRSSARKSLVMQGCPVRNAVPVRPRLEAADPQSRIPDSLSRLHLARSTQ